MEFIYPIVILLGVYFLARYLHKQGVITGPYAAMPRKKVESAKDWDEEFLRAEAAKHSLDRIEETTVVFAAGNPGNPRPGFRWVCTCGEKKSVIRVLKVAEHSYRMHQTNMREAALAQLGRFK